MLMCPPAERKQPLKRSKFLGIDGAVLSEKSPKEAIKWHTATLAVPSYSKRGAQIAGYIMMLFHESNVAELLQNEGQYLQLVLETS